MTNTYDNLDRLTQMQDPLGTSSFSYDADGRVTGFTDPNGFTLSYVYDAAGNITQITYPDGTAVAYAYDAANRLATVTDWLGEQATYAYDQDGRLATFTQLNGIATTYAYDAASRLTGIASAVSSYQFTLDGDGNRVQSTESQPLAPTASNGTSALYTYNTPKDRLLSAGPLSYAYDNEGQLVTSGGTCLTFDYNHWLVEIGDDTQFSYDGRGNRLIATRSAVTTVYIYDPWGNLIATADGLGNITAKYIYGKGLIAMAAPSGRYCYHFNGTASTIAITDMNQNLVNSYAYDPFGQILAQQETIPQPFKYVGQYGVMAEPNGLYYMRARYYDPTVGRFISEDPLGFGGGDVNLYAYVQSNPINRIDPLGLFGWADMPMLPQGVVDFSAGFGDNLSIHLTDLIRNWNGTNVAVNKCSRSYSAGGWAGFTLNILIGGAAGAEAAEANAGIQGYEFSHWIPVRMGGPRSIWNGNYVSQEMHYLTDPFRYPSGWQDWGPKLNTVLQQLLRIPYVYDGAAAGAAYGGASAMAGGNSGCN